MVEMQRAKTLCGSHTYALCVLKCTNTDDLGWIDHLWFDLQRGNIYVPYAVREQRVQDMETKGMRVWDKMMQDMGVKAQDMGMRV